MNIDLKLLDEKGLPYFNSISDFFNYRLKNFWKYTTWSSLFSLSAFFFSINIIPILPALIKTYFPTIIKLLNDNLFALNQDSFLARWLAGSSLALIIMLLVYPVYKIWDKKIEKKALSRSALSFCYLFSSINELKFYLINERNEHLIRANKYLKEVLDNYDLVSIGETSTTLSNVIEVLEKRFNWYKIENRTRLYIDTINSFQHKIFNRIKQKTQIEELIPGIGLLTLYEYSRIKPNEQNSENQRIGDNTGLYFEEFIKAINNLSVVEPSFEESSTRTKSLLTILNWIGNLLSNENLIVMFITWLIVLSAIFALGSIILIKLLDFYIDTTFLIGMLSAPFVGAITFSATIYSKNKTHGQ